MRWIFLSIPSESHNLSYSSQEFINAYDCGSVVIALQTRYVKILTLFFYLPRKWKNLQIFFNIENGWYVILVQFFPWYLSLPFIYIFI